MKDIQELLQNVDTYNEAILQQRFQSKKNTVAQVIHNNKPRVFKWFAPGFKKNIDTEYNILTTAISKILLPQSVEKDEKNHLLMMNYIPGENLCDVVNNTSLAQGEKQQYMKKLANWFFTFHHHYKTHDGFIIRGDAGLRNFIVNTQIWGIDFEEAHPGKPVEDLAECCGSLLTTNPMFTSEKYELCVSLIQCYNDQEPGLLLDINNETAYALIKKIPYRRNDETILRAHAKTIKQKGFDYRL